MIPLPLAQDIDTLIRRASKHWLQAVCSTLDGTPESTDARSVIANLLVTNNSDMAHCLANIVRQAEQVLPWKALSTSIDLCSAVYSQWEREQRAELLWTGPSPASQIPARRIDQVLYDLIDSARREVLLVTFAAHKISRLTDALGKMHSLATLNLVLFFRAATFAKGFENTLTAYVAMAHWHCCPDRGDCN